MGAFWRGAHLLALHTAPSSTPPRPACQADPVLTATFCPCRFYFPYRQSLSESKLYYSYDVAGAHVIMLSSYSGDMGGVLLLLLLLQSVFWCRSASSCCFLC